MRIGRSEIVKSFVSS